MNTSSHGMTVNDFGLEHAHWRNWVGNQSCVRAARAARTQDWLPTQLRQCACSRPKSLTVMPCDEVFMSLIPVGPCFQIAV